MSTFVSVGISKEVILPPFRSRIIIIGTRFSKTLLEGLLLRHRAERVMCLVFAVSSAGEKQDAIEAASLTDELRADIKLHRAENDDAKACKALGQFLYDCDPGVMPNEIIFDLPVQKYPLIAAACREFATRWFYGKGADEPRRDWPFDALVPASPTTELHDSESADSQPALSSRTGKGFRAQPHRRRAALGNLRSCVVNRWYPRRPTALVVASRPLLEAFVASLTKLTSAAFAYIQLAEAVPSDTDFWRWPESPDLVFCDKPSSAALGYRHRWGGATWVVANEGEDDAARAWAVNEAFERQAHATLPDVLVAWSPRSADSVEPLWVTRPLGRGAQTLPANGDYQPTPELMQVRQLWNDEAPKVVSLVGLGGCGKTSLARRFLEECVLTAEMQEQEQEPTGVNQSPRSDAIFVWDFYAQPFSEKFLHSFASYLNPDSAVESGSSECLRLIRRGLLERNLRRVLLVLDGLETIQSPSASSDKGELQDAFVAELLGDIVAGELPLMALLTTRLAPVIREDRKAGNVQILLGGLSDETGRAIMRGAGACGDDEQLTAVVRRFKGHVMTLAHLGRMLGDFYQGDLAAVERLPVVERTLQRTGFGAIDEINRNFVQLFARYEEHFSEQELALLKCMALVGEPLTAHEFVQIFIEAGVRHVTASLAGLGPDEIQSRFDALRTRHLVNLYTGAGGQPSYATHPMLSYYFVDALTADAEEALSLNAKGYYEQRLDALGADFGTTNVAVRTRGAIRARGAAVGLRGSATTYPTNTVVLDLLERVIFYTVRSGRTEEARLYYQRRMGGDEHLEAIDQQARAQRIRNCIETRNSR